MTYYLLLFNVPKNKIIHCLSHLRTIPNNKSHIWTTYKILEVRQQFCNIISCKCSAEHRNLDAEFFNETNVILFLFCTICRLCLYAQIWMA